MVRSYLVIEKGLIEERVFPIEERVNIGRSPLNGIYVADPSVSRRHAVVYFSGGKSIVEDLGSHNGTYVNGDRVRKAVLRNSDILRVGKVSFRFVQEDVEESPAGTVTQEILRTTQEMLQGTQEMLQARISIGPEATTLSQRSRRLSEAISKIMLFKSLEADGVAQVAQAARLVVFDRGRTVFRQGDRGQSLFIVLDGKVRLIAYDQEGKELPLDVLSENQFFGEVSFLTGEPRDASAIAVEESLLCELGFDAMREIVRKSPQIKAVLETYFRDRVREVEAKKREAGVVDRRRHPRVNEKLNVSFSVSPTTPVSGQFRGKIFRSISKDISVSGIRVKVQDRYLLGLPAGCQLRLEIVLPHGWGSVRTLGILRNIVEGKEGQDLGYLGVEFEGMPAASRKRMEEFIRGVPS